MSLQSKNYNCNSVATNSGPFDADGSSSGPLAIWGKIPNNHSTDFIGFGVARDFKNDGRSNKRWFLENYHQLIKQLSLSLSSFVVWDIVTGFNWSPCEGVNVVDDSANDLNPTGAL